MKICENPECENVLTGRQKRFCSYACNGKALASARLTPEACKAGGRAGGNSAKRKAWFQTPEGIAFREELAAQTRRKNYEKYRGEFHEDMMPKRKTATA